jgi:PAS domain S-box-containing protein
MPGWRLHLPRNEAKERAGADAAHRAEIRFSALVDSVQDGVWVIAPDGTIEAANHRLAQLFGVDLHDVTNGFSQAEVLENLKAHFASPQEALSSWQRLQQQPEQVAWDEIELLRPRRRVLERFSRPLVDSRQQVIGRLEIYRDITDQRFLEDKVVQRERLATLGQLISGVAHELNNPLTAVAGYAELLRAEELPPSLREKLEQLSEEAARASSILKGVLLFARGDEAERQPVDLVELLERAASLRAYELKVENIRIVRHYQPRLPRVAANPVQLQQVFLNILLNAEQAIRSHRRHGCITVRVDWLAEKERLRVEIADNGAGIAASALPHIFEPFFTTKPAQEGTGLGLSISQAIVREHGGEIGVESEPGQGAVFAVELPFRGAPAHRAPSRPVLPTVPRSARRGRRILVVDDEPVVAHLIADTLRQQGFVVRLHTDSRRALQEATEKNFDLIICDIRMPEVDGPAFHRLLQERKPALAHRLLFTTGDTLARETLRFLEQVHLPNLAKPFHVDELRAAVNNALQGSRRRNSGRSDPVGRGESVHD